MPTNRMLYRVFLQDERDAPSPTENPENHFRIRSGEMNAWRYTSPNWNPNLEEQLMAMDFGSHVGPSTEQLDEHWLIEHDGLPIGIVHSKSEIPERAYELATREARNLANYLSRSKGKSYVFIDLTSKCDRKIAESLATRINNEYIETGCVSGNPALCADIGD